MRSTIKDVAKLADVSTATVSNVLNDSKNVSDALRTRVFDAIEQLDYRPNTIARSLKINRSYIIGVIIPDVMNPFFAEVLKSIQLEAVKLDYQIMMYDSGKNKKREKKLIDQLIHSGVDGIINITSYMDEEDLKDGFSVPMVIADRHPFDTSDRMGFVCADNEKCGRIAAEHLLEKNYDLYVCIAGPAEETTVAANRWKGFREKLIEEGIPEDEIIVSMCKYTFDDGLQEMNKLLKLLPTNKRYGIYASSDVMAWGAIEACNSHKVRIPEQIGIIGNDDIWCSQFVQKGMTTVHSPADKLGMHAVKLLFHALDDSGMFREHSQILKPSLIIRKTT